MKKTCDIIWGWEISTSRTEHGNYLLKSQIVATCDAFGWLSVLLQKYSRVEFFIQFLLQMFRTNYFHRNDDLFCGMVGWWKACFYLQLGPVPKILTIVTLRHAVTGFEPVQNLSLGFDEWSCAVVITTTPQQIDGCRTLIIQFSCRKMKAFLFAQIISEKNASS